MLYLVSDESTYSTEHAHVGVAAGLTPSQLTIIRDINTPLPLPTSPAPLSPIQAAALRFADASTFSVHVPQQKIDELKLYLKDDQQLLEATAVTATYNMVSRFLVALDVGEMSDDLLPLPETLQEEHEVEVEAGLKLNVRTAKRVGDDGAPWLIMVNSLMSNQKMWDGVLPRLSKKYNLLTFDQRGHGKVKNFPSPCDLTLLIFVLSNLVFYPFHFCYPRNPLCRYRQNPHHPCYSHPRARSHRSISRRSHDPRVWSAPPNSSLPTHRL